MRLLPRTKLRLMAWSLRYQYALSLLVGVCWLMFMMPVCDAFGRHGVDQAVELALDLWHLPLLVAIAYVLNVAIEPFSYRMFVLSLRREQGKLADSQS